VSSKLGAIHDGEGIKSANNMTFFVGAIIVLVFGTLFLPLLMIFPYLARWAFPGALIKQYGTSIAALSVQSFILAITDEDRSELKRLDYLNPATCLMVADGEHL